MPVRSIPIDVYAYRTVPYRTLPYLTLPYLHLTLPTLPYLSYHLPIYTKRNGNAEEEEENEKKRIPFKILRFRFTSFSVIDE